MDTTPSLADLQADIAAVGAAAGGDPRGEADGWTPYYTAGNTITILGPGIVREIYTVTDNASFNLSVQGATVFSFNSRTNQETNDAPRRLTPNLRFDGDLVVQPNTDSINLLVQHLPASPIPASDQ